MTNIRFVSRHRHSDSARYWRWRDLRSSLATSRRSDTQIDEEFSRQAAQVREQVEFLIGGAEGTEEALATLAEEDMTNFCILVDLAEGVSIAGVQPLQVNSKERLVRFLNQEPWRSLAVDNEISVALALLDSIGAPESDVPLERQPAGSVALLESVLQRVNVEQYQRFLQEFDLLRTRDNLRLPDTLNSVMAELISQAAHRLGQPPPRISG